MLTFVFSLCFQSSHIHLIDALMMAYTLEMISIQKVVSSVKRFANFSDSKELPFDLEEAMVFWINKVGLVNVHFHQCFCFITSPYLSFVATGKCNNKQDHSKRAENEATFAGVT